MSIYYRTQGVFVNKKNWGENDQLFTVYTKDFGKINIIGKSIRKIKSKLRPGAELFYFSEIEFIQGKRVKTLTDARAIDKFKNIKQSFKKTTIAHKFFNNLDKLINEQEPNIEIWDLIISFLNRLNNSQVIINNLKPLYFFYFWRILSESGYLPELYNCLICRSEIKQEDNYFDCEKGGLICQNCFSKLIEPQKELNNLKINSNIIKILRIVFKKNWNLFSRLRIKTEDEETINRITTIFLKHKS